MKESENVAHQVEVYSEPFLCSSGHWKLDFIKELTVRKNSGQWLDAFLDIPFEAFGRFRGNWRGIDAQKIADRADAEAIFVDLKRNLGVL